MSIRGWVAHVAAGIANYDPRVRRLQRDLDGCKLMLADVLNEQRSGRRVARLADAEYRVFSQFGDDGIIQYLTRTADVRVRSFVELGVGDYSEANTRLLLVKDGWRGLICDCDRLSMKRVRWNPISWQYNLTIAEEFLHRDNINGILAQRGFSGEIGLFSIDVDGNDYYIWDAIDVIQPTIVVAEYNAVFGAGAAVSVPYNPTGTRFGAHYSGLYWGASLRALETVANRKSYALVGCNSAGNNCYFVKRDRLGPLAAVTVDEAFVPQRFRDSRDAQGRLSYLDPVSALRAIADMPVVDVETGATRPAGTLA